MPASERFSTSFFFPVYNEIQYVEQITRKAKQVLEQASDDFEILIIDDGSTDGSQEVADALALSDPRVRVIHHQENRGYGQALRTGFHSATKDVIIYTDCDEPLDLGLIQSALPRLKDYDMVIGYRLNRWEGVLRFFYSNFYNLIVRLLFRVRVRDINFSFKLIRRGALRKLNLGAESVFIDGELLSEAVRHRLRICEVPVQYLPREHGSSNFNTIRAATHTLKEIWAYWLKRRRRHSAVPADASVELESGCRGDAGTDG
jgi:glycosyltransferase involved in cell wall biosynthesis